MKRIALFLAGVLAFAGLATSCHPTLSIAKLGNPDSALVGTWVNDSTINENSSTGRAYDSYTFNADGTFSQKGYMKMEIKDTSYISIIDISFSGAGTYGVADGKINFKFKASEAEAVLNDFDVRLLGESADPKAASITKTIVNLIMVRPMMKAMKTSMKKDQVYILNSLSSDTLRMTNSTAKDPKTDTFIKAE